MEVNAAASPERILTNCRLLLSPYRTSPIVLPPCIFHVSGDHSGSDGREWENVFVMWLPLSGVLWWAEFTADFSWYCKSLPAQIVDLFIHTIVVNQFLIVSGFVLEVTMMDGALTVGPLWINFLLNSLNYFTDLVSSSCRNCKLDWLMDIVTGCALACGFILSSRLPWQLMQLRHQKEFFLGGWFTTKVISWLLRWKSGQEQTL